MKDPDRGVRARLDYLFRQFERLGVARKVLLHFREQGLTLPTKVWGGPQHGRIVWKPATFSTIVHILHNPCYAGTYVYGQCEYDPFDRSLETGKARPHPRPPEDWPVCIHGAFPAYITWEKFLENRRLLRANWYRQESRGAPRKGTALLQGIVFCGRCGNKMGIQHFAGKEKRSPAYTCYYAYQNEGGPSCQCMSAQVVDQAVTDLFLGAVSPAKVEIALHALEEWERDRAAARKQRELQIQQAEYAGGPGPKAVRSGGPREPIGGRRTGIPVGTGAKGLWRNCVAASAHGSRTKATVSAQRSAAGSRSCPLIWSACGKQRQRLRRTARRCFGSL